MWLSARSGGEIGRRHSNGVARRSAWSGNPVQYPECIGLVLGTGETKINMALFLERGCSLTKVPYHVTNAPLWIWIKHQGGPNNKEVMNFASVAKDFFQWSDIWAGFWRARSSTDEKYGALLVEAIAERRCVQRKLQKGKASQDMF